MIPARKRGAVRLLILILITLSLIFFPAQAKRYTYLTTQNVAFRLGINLNNIASNKYVDFIKTQKGIYQQTSAATFLNEPTVGSKFTELAQVLGESTDNSPQDKRIEVDLSEQKLFMIQNGKIINTYLVSTGKWSPTPTGEWKVWGKYRYIRMTGGSKALNTFYDLPNVPYVLFFYQGYGIHGAYWHNNFGQPMSHGCVNLSPENAAVVYNWAPVGTKVIIHS